MPPGLLARGGCCLVADGPRLALLLHRTVLRVEYWRSRCRTGRRAMEPRRWWPTEARPWIGGETSSDPGGRQAAATADSSSQRTGRDWSLG